MQKRLQHIIKGQVQGVGFRPFVFRLAHAHKLIGFVTNTSLGVIIEVEGSQEQLNAFNEEFIRTLPPLAKISSHKTTEIPLVNHRNTANLDAFKKQNIESQEAIISEESNIVKDTNEKYSFIIKHSEESKHGGHSVLVSPDTATCKDCQNDILTKGNYRYAYPFTNCTNCGPRYTITHTIPYDRPYTSMACFPFCPTCKKEYENPYDRRFHAQPNACTKCGPNLWLIDAKTAENIDDNPHLPNTFTQNINQETIIECIQLLKESKIIAIKALGGFQLTCNAYDEKAIKELRIRKRRPHKAFAIMVADIEEAKKIAHITRAAEELLCSPAAPIVLCPKHDMNLPQSIAPDTNRIGIMLAYTPLHKMLFNAKFLEKNKNSFFPKALIMTSANANGEPICIKNRHAIEKLKHITDYYLFHNRDILVRVDDSVCLALTNKTHMKKGETETQLLKTNKLQAQLPSTLFFRRARGYVPSPIQLPNIIGLNNSNNSNNSENLSSIVHSNNSEILNSSNTLKNKSCLIQNKSNSILAVGAFLKSTFCLTRKNEAFVSQHIGDLDNLAVTEFYEETFVHLRKLLEIKPSVVVSDLHPDFPSTHFAKKIAEQYKIPLIQLAHHYAHVYAVLAEYNEYDFSPSLALILDGTGLGPDNTSWGGELLYVVPKTGLMLRLGRIQPIILPGGEVAIKEPWRIAQGMYEICLQKKYITSESNLVSFPWLQDENCAKISPMLSTMIEKNIQCVESSGCGRLFDAISALFGLCYVSSYEGQAAIKLESAQFMQTKQPTSSTIHTNDGIPTNSTKLIKSTNSTEFTKTMESIHETKIFTQNEKNNSQHFKKTQKNFYDCPIHEDAEMKKIKIERINSQKDHAHKIFAHSIIAEAKSINNISTTGTLTHKNTSPSTENSNENSQDIKPIWNLDTYALFAYFVQELTNQKSIHELAQNFHQTLSHSLCKMAEKGMQLTGVTNIVLGGGVMNNETLLNSMHETLTKQGFNVLTPKDMPSGDGAISLGQAFYGLLELQRKK